MADNLDGYIFDAVVLDFENYAGLRCLDVPGYGRDRVLTADKVCVIVVTDAH